MLGMVMPTPSGGECCDPHFIDKETETQGREVPRQRYTAWKCTEPGFESRLHGEFGLQVGVGELLWRDVSQGRRLEAGGPRS